MHWDYHKFYNQWRLLVNKALLGIFGTDSGCFTEKDGCDCCIIVTIIVTTNSTTRTHVMLNSNRQIGSPTLLDRSYPRSEHPLQIRLNGRGLYLAAWLITNPRLQVEISWSSFIENYTKVISSMIPCVWIFSSCWLRKTFLWLSSE